MSDAVQTSDSRGISRYNSSAIGRGAELQGAERFLICRVTGTLTSREEATYTII